MVIVRDIRYGDDDALTRELQRIRRFFKIAMERGENLRIQWGTVEAFKKMEKPV